ncbi:hypothetical protein D3C77_653090 [compost metagenome]
MPDMRIATLGSKPISSGASTVEPNMATTCCAPIATFLGQDNLSSGAMMTPGSASSARRQRGKYEFDINIPNKGLGERAPV